MNFQEKLFLQKWNKSLSNSKQIIADKCSKKITDDGLQLLLIFKPLKTQISSSYANKINSWCYENNINSNIVDAYPDGYYGEEYTGLLIDFNI
jgi:hypothetical protein